RCCHWSGESGRHSVQYDWYFWQRHHAWPRHAHCPGIRSREICRMSPHTLECTVSLAISDPGSNGCCTWLYPVVSPIRAEPATGGADSAIFEGPCMEYVPPGRLFRFEALFAVDGNREASGVCPCFRQSGEPGGKLVLCLRPSGLPKVWSSRQRLVHLRFPHLYGGGSGSGGHLLRPQAQQ